MRADGRLVVVGRNGAQLFFCFAGSALLNVLSPSFFARAAAGDKDAWLSATLLAGTVASALGVPAAQRLGLPGRPRLAGVGLVVSASTLLVATLFVGSPLAFAVLSVSLRFLLQYGTHELDRRAVLLSGAGARRRNDAVGLAMRFGGMLLGPLWFGLARDRTGPLLVVIGLLTALAAGNAHLVGSAPSAPAVSTVAASPGLDRGARWLLWGSRAIYAAYYLLASSIIYVLTDVHGVGSAVRRGGVIVTLVYGCAIVTTLAAQALGRAPRRSPLDMLATTATLVLVGLALPWGASPWAQGAGAVLLGAAFARFQMTFRDRATHDAVHRGAPALLAAYNNLGTTSALLGYAVMVALVGLSRLLGLSYASLVGLGVAALGAVATPLVVGAERATFGAPASPPADPPPPGPDPAP